MQKYLTGNRVVITAVDYFPISPVGNPLDSQTGRA